MRDSILNAIDAICGDITADANFEYNYKRAETIVALTVCGLLLPDKEDKTAAGEPEPPAHKKP